VPPLSPTISAPPKVGEANQFVAGLGGTSRLVHAPVVTTKSDEAPKGLVHGLASPLPPDVASISTRSAATDSLDGAPGTTGEGSPLPPPIQRPVTPVARTAPDTPPLTRVPSEAVELRHPAPASPVPAIAEPAHAPAAHEPGPEVSDAVSVADVDPTVPARRTLGESRRLGLGLPISRPADEPFSPLAAPEPPAPIHRPLPTAPEEVRPAPPIPEPTPPAPASSGAEPVVEDREPMVHRPEPRVEAAEPAAPAEAPTVTAAVRSGEPAAAPEAPPAAPEPVLPHYRPGPAVEPRPLPAEPSALIVEAPPAAPTVRVPGALATVLQATHGVDVSDVKVHRGPQVSTEARALGAVAFARDQEVFLPPEAGPIDEPATLGLLAHELTHVVQQRTLGGAPREGTNEAERLEVEARTAERYFRGDAGAPAPRPVAQTLTHPPKPTVAVGLSAGEYADQVADELVSRGIARRDDDGSLAFGPPPEAIEAQVSAAVQLATATASTGEVQTLDSWRLDDYVDDIRSGAVEADSDQYFEARVAQENRRREEAGEPPLDPDFDAPTYDRLREESEDEFTNVAAGSGRSGTGQGERRPTPPRTLGESLFANVAGEFGAEIDFGALGSRSTASSGSDRPDRPESAGDEDSAGGVFDRFDPFDNRNPSESGRPEIVADDIDLQDLARRMWELTRTELRNELLVDRERWGRLTDFR
jgi:hypothetical protein